MPKKGRELELPDAQAGMLEELEEVFAILQDTERPWEDRAAIWQALHGLQLVVNRQLRAAKDALVWAMDHGGVERAGRLRLKWRAKAVEWPCNEPAAWTDPDVQGGLERVLQDPIGRLFVRVVPAHLELDTAYLGSAMMAPAQVAPPGIGPEALQEYARALHAEAKRAGWRVEYAPAPTLEVDPVKPAKKS